ncbi:MAG TPA: hypothetical protein PK385_11865 [Spirochaetota bacterium]|jgi:hypothetical protein|nr:MAG: hypothetical protein BWX91_02418 [Spirochaetes bacterium ADurb.Bin133]HNZ27355.1 hypothetical protein [Spirochaetota bacterium]HOF01867.1 hypothetical protein [Spirochaetota bacterium]HOS33606.1 hypothetical protein [Spirochaetota bacterium]HOS56739.1 hypothetical protein [Spirochaetota bacterium]
MEINNIKNKLIILKNDNSLKKELVAEIQNALLVKNKESEFSALLKKVESQLKDSQSVKK